MYAKVKIGDTDEDVAVDASGYTGNFQRIHNDKRLLPYTAEQLLKLVSLDSKMVEIMRAIKDIDKERNGYVTSTELDDILKIHYKKDLIDKNLMPIFSPYSSIQNKILIDYKKFRDFLIKGINDNKLKQMSILREQKESRNEYYDNKINYRSNILSKRTTRVSSVE